MSSIIEQLYLGNVRPDSFLYSDDSSLNEAIKHKGKCMEELTEKLDVTAKELFNNYCNAQADVDDIIQYGIFTYALKLGALLMVEILTGNDTIFFGSESNNK